MQHFRPLIAGTIACLLFAGSAADDGPDRSVDVARFDSDGALLVPADMDEWIFLGSSLGMGYSQENFDPDSPGMFQIARMEPRAYEAFVETGRFVDGTMIALHFFGSQNEISINRAGFVMGEQHFAEIHYKDSKRFPDGFNFYNVENGQNVAEEMPLPNECVACHRRDGAYDGVFVQFYPVIHKHLSDDVRARLQDAGTRDGH
ncbi:MAG: cytochrome P460 family protein [Woeseiaceae bacterium]